MSLSFIMHDNNPPKNWVGILRDAPAYTVHTQKAPFFVPTQNFDQAKGCETGAYENHRTFPLHYIITAAKRGKFLSWCRMYFLRMKLDESRHQCFHLLRLFQKHTC